MTVLERLRSCWGPTWLAWRSPVKQASEITSTALWVNNHELALMSFPMRHISHCNQVLRLCHPEKSSCSGEFSCRSFAKIALSSLSTICHVKNLRVFVSHNSARFPWNISPPHFVTGTKKLQAKVLDSTCQTTKFVNNCRRMWNLMVWHFWQH